MPIDSLMFAFRLHFILPWSPWATLSAETLAVIDVLSEVCPCRSRETVYCPAARAYKRGFAAAAVILVDVLQEVALPKRLATATADPVDVVRNSCSEVPQEVFPFSASPARRTGSAVIVPWPCALAMLGFHVCPMSTGQVVAFRGRWEVEGTYNRALALSNRARQCPHFWVRGDACVCCPGVVPGVSGDCPVTLGPGVGSKTFAKAEEAVAGLTSSKIVKGDGDD
ncbi:hypothetical protein LIA77_11170 [Sarocladium implicatum]|nr:hypothetical protein LIA77_11170 [Sarocladium implicatum]